MNHSLVRFGFLVSLSAVAACSGRESDPFVPTQVPTPIWAANFASVSVSPFTSLAAAGTNAGGRDELGTMHLVWADASILRHGFIAINETNWSLRTIPTTAGAIVRGAALGYAIPGIFIAAWSEDRNDGQFRVMVSRSSDHGATWDVPIQLVAGPTVSTTVALYAFARSSGGSGAVVAWTEGSPARVKSSAWSGTLWASAQWSTPSFISSSATGSAREVVLAGRGDVVIAAWTDTRTTAAGDVFMSKSITAGSTWQADAKAAVSRVPATSPSVTFTSAGSLLLAYVSSGSVYVTSVPDVGGTFAVDVALGTGVRPHVTTGENGRSAVSWDYTSTAIDSDSRTGLAISYDNFLTESGPFVMPGSETTTARVQSAVFLAGRTMDVVWVDVSGGTRAVEHRTAALP